MAGFADRKTRLTAAEKQSFFWQALGQNLAKRLSVAPQCLFFVQSGC